MFRRILVPTDGSVFGDAALPVAADLARVYGAALTVTYVIPDPLLHLIAAGPYSYADSRANGPEEARSSREHAERVMESVARQLGSAEVDGQVSDGQASDGQASGGQAFKRLVLDGLTRDVADCLAEAVQTEQADALVMSTHGQGGLLKLFLGSVAERVLRKVNVPVLLVHPVRSPAGKILSGH